MYEGNCQKRESECKDCSTWTEAEEFGDAKDMQIQVNFLLRENDNLKKQLLNRRLEFELFDREVKSRLREATSEDKCRLQDTEDRPESENRRLESLLREHLEYARVLIAELQLAGERENARRDSSTQSLQVVRPRSKLYLTIVKVTH